MGVQATAVDTYDTVEGVRKAVEVGKKLRERGFEMVGVRLDSGDLAYLSIKARKILDEGGFPQATIVASNDLDEQVITSLKEQDAKITVWGVGTKLATAFDQPALGGVYKIGALRKDDGSWDYKVKLSEQAIKVSNPGILQVRRYQENGVFAGDMIYNLDQPLPEHPIMLDPMDATRRKDMSSLEGEDLLIPVFNITVCQAKKRGGKLVGRVLIDRSIISVHAFKPVIPIICWSIECHDIKRVFDHRDEGQE